MKDNSRRIGRYTLVFAVLIIAVIVITVLNIVIGSVNISVGDIIGVLFGNAEGTTQSGIIWKIRMPRVFMAAILGGALALSGFLLQTFFANPIAGPYILGISSGAKLFVSFAMIIVTSYVGHVGSFELIVAAFLGSLASIGFVLLVSRKVKRMSMLLVAGIMIGYICTAITDFVVTFAADSDIVNLHNWSKGSFSGMSWSSVQTAFFVVIITSIIVFLLSKPIGAFQLGEAYAQSVGVNIQVFKVVLILLSSILSACVTAFAGPISFVGIAVPHLIKLFLKTSKPIIVIPAVFLGGSVFCMGCDLIARTVFAPSELAISTVTAIFGAPIVIWMIIKRQTR
ncbi:MAG: iron ABC transporter permease [Lachnospiraceae bacterium]|jgi:iron complex transport system permease protein|nr:iron ABC transporter permease [Lachnospiraceae bacterium]